jgi:hypothetical protein
MLNERSGKGSELQLISWITIIALDLRHIVQHSKIHEPKPECFEVMRSHKLIYIFFR